MTLFFPRLMFKIIPAIHFFSVLKTCRGLEGQTLEATPPLELHLFILHLKQSSRSLTQLFKNN